MQFKMSFISVMQSWIFCSHYSSLHDLMLSHDPSEIILICWLAAQETFLIIIYVEMLKTVVMLNIFVETLIIFFQDSLNKNNKKQH